MAAVYFIFFAEVAAYRAGTRRLQRLGINYSVSPLCPREADISWHLPQGSHAHDETDAHAHTHDHEPPLGVDVTAPAPDHHIHPDHSNITSHPHGHHRTSSGEKGKDAESASDVSTVNQLPSQAEAAAQLIAVAVLEFGVVLHSWVFLKKLLRLACIDLFSQCYHRSYSRCRRILRYPLYCHHLPPNVRRSRSRLPSLNPHSSRKFVVDAVRRRHFLLSMHTCWRRHRSRCSIHLQR